MGFAHSSLSPRFERCVERVLGTCNDGTENCCAIVPCKLCLELDKGEDEPEVGSADFDGEEYFGLIDGHTFTAYWTKDAYGVCEFVVEWDGEEVSSDDLCSYVGAGDVTCRDPSGEATVDTGYEQTGELSWFPSDEVELRHHRIDDAETDDCLEPFCGDCTCTCRKICVEVVFTDNLDAENSCTANGKFGFTGNLCADGSATSAEWDGTSACENGAQSWAGSISMTRGEDYDEGLCVLRGELVSGLITLTLPAEPIINCTNLGTSWTISTYEYTAVVTVSCASCGECLPPGFLEPCCPETPAPPALNWVVTIQGLGSYDPPEPPCTGSVVMGGGFSNTEHCPACCIDGATIGDVTIESDPLDPTQDVLAYHAGDSGVLNGVPIEICIIACKGETEYGSLPEPESDDPDDELVVYTVWLNGAEADYFAVTKCSPVGFTIDMGTAVALQYCPNDPGARLILTVTE